MAGRGRRLSTTIFDDFFGFVMTKRLYYDSAEIHEFDSVVEDVVPLSPEQPRPSVILRETAFYPTSGGQVHDTGWLTLDKGDRLRVAEVAERKTAGSSTTWKRRRSCHWQATKFTAVIDPERRRDHMQQHSGQHVLSAAFVELYQMPTVSFHMGASEAYCSIDLGDAVANSRADCRSRKTRQSDCV